ncbi:hypothetical protein C8R44DRAFT_774457 [Mycena epipterygia]|nr:hypothetical protein C8R44DRAFT_774457 [Mycena epipterygia]
MSGADVLIAGGAEERLFKRADLRGDRGMPVTGSSESTDFAISTIADIDKATKNGWYPGLKPRRRINFDRGRSLSLEKSS